MSSDLKETASEPENGEEEALDEKTLHLDQDVKAAIAALLREYATELTTTSQDDDSPSRNKKRKEKKEEVMFMILGGMNVLILVTVL